MSDAKNSAFLLHYPMHCSPSGRRQHMPYGIPCRLPYIFYPVIAVDCLLLNSGWQRRSDLRTDSGKVLARGVHHIGGDESIPGGEPANVGWRRVLSLTSRTTTESASSLTSVIYLSVRCIRRPILPHQTPGHPRSSELVRSLFYVVEYMAEQCQAI
jgi:hypothetical protein